MKAELIVPSENADNDALLGALRADAWDTLKDIMKSSQSEKVRILCAMAILDRTQGVEMPVRSLARPRSMGEAPSEPVTLKAAAEQREARAKVLEYINARPDDVHTAPKVAGALGIQSGMVSALLVQLHRDTMIGKCGQGMYRAVKEP